MTKRSTLTGVTILLTILSCVSAFAVYEQLTLMRDETLDGAKRFTFIVDSDRKSIDVSIYCSFVNYKGNAIAKGQLVDGYLEFDGRRILTDKQSAALITTVYATLPGKHSIRVHVTSPTGAIWVESLSIRNETKNAIVSLIEVK